MIKIENVEVMGWEAAIRGMRNPMNSWDKSDSYFEKRADCAGYYYKQLDKRGNMITDWMTLGSNDRDLMLRLASGGPVHAKYRRMIAVYCDITAPLYWWKEFDTYKVGTVANSCSTMHKIHEKEFEFDDFSHEHLLDDVFKSDECVEFFGNDLTMCGGVFGIVIDSLNLCRDLYLKTKDKKYWWQMIQLLPSSYNQKRTVMLNYEVLAGVYPMRKDHKLDEWREFCQWIEELPYSEIITGTEEKADG